MVVWRWRPSNVGDVHASSSPMHIFVRQYMRLQFDCEREESHEDKRMMICLEHGLPTGMLKCVLLLTLGQHAEYNNVFASF